MGTCKTPKKKLDNGKKTFIVVNPFVGKTQMSDCTFQISYDELMWYIEHNGINIREKFLGYDRQELKSFGDFMVGLQECLLTNVKRLFTQVSVTYFNKERYWTTVQR